MAININEPAFWCFIGTKCLHGAEEAQHTNQLQLTQAPSDYCDQTVKKAKVLVLVMCDFRK